MELTAKISISKMHIGKHIKAVMLSKNITTTELAKRINTTRTNMHKIFHKENLDIKLLMLICDALEYDFFKDLSDENKFPKGSI